MIGFGFMAQFGCFGFDEIADLHFVGEPRTRTHSGIGTNPAMGADYGTVQMGVRRYLAAHANGDIAQHAACAYPHIIGQPDLALEYAIDIDEDVFAAVEFTPNVEAPGIGQSYSTRHVQA